MKRSQFGTICAIGVISFAGALARAESAPAGTAKVVGAANAFLATLTDAQRGKMLFAFDDSQQRARWSNFPTGFVRRAGVSIGELDEKQRGAEMDLLRAVLSEKGFEKVQEIMEGDEALKKTDGGGGPGGPRGGPGGGPRGGFGGGPGGGPGGGQMFGKELYYISFLGKPSEKEQWMLQFGGHHLALNITIAGDKGVLTPTLTGAQPTLYQLNGKTVRPLGAENDKAFALLQALNDEERKQAILNYHVSDLVLGPGHDGETIQPEGLKVSAMNDQQRAMLLDLMSEWVGIVNDSYAKARIEEIKAGLGETYFAWSGPTTHEEGKNGTAYYRIQGPKVVIEFAPQPIGGDLTLHVHTMYRDPTNDYGRALTTK